MDWLASPWTVLSILVIVVGLIVLAVLGYRIRLSKDRGLEAIRDSSSKPEPLMPEKYVKEIISMVERAGEHRDTLRDLRDKTLETQMSLYEELSLAAIAVLKEGFRKRLADLAIPQDQARREFREYCHMVRGVINDELKAYMRKWLKTNHYNLKSEQEWVTYVETKQKTIFHLVSEAFDREWIGDAISAEEVRSICDTLLNTIGELVSQMFREARITSIQKAKEAYNEKQRYSAYIRRMTGLDPYAPEEIE